MTSTQRVVIVDDLNGSTEDVEAVWIGLEGDLYEVDLSAQHRQQLMAVLGPFIAHARLLPQDEDARRPRRPHKPPPADYVTKAVTRARIVPAPVGYEHPDYPWIPFKSAGRVLAEQVRAWAAARGIPMPHRGIPRSVLLAYRSRQQTNDLTIEQATEQTTENEGGSATA